LKLIRILFSKGRRNLPKFLFTGRVSMDKEEIVKIWDCRQKELLRIERKGGDLSLEFRDPDGRVIFTSWYQMKKPYKENFEKIVKLFSGLRDLLERQELVKYLFLF
jgi:hypothetical protein